MVVAVALLAAVGNPCGQSIVLFWEESGLPVTGDEGLKVLSGEVSDVRRTPRLVTQAALKREVGFLVEDKGENLRSESGGWRGTPRLVILFVSH